MAKNIILDPTPIEVPENATFEDLMKMWPKEPVTEWKQIVDAALQSARSETFNHYLETDMLWVDFLSDGTAIVFLGNHH